jgi:hypothetical protein
MRSMIHLLWFLTAHPALRARQALYLSPVKGISHTCVNGSGDDARIG